MNTEDLDINSEVLEAVSGLSVAIGLIAKGGSAFKERLDDLRSATADNENSVANFNDAAEKHRKAEEAAELAEKKALAAVERAQKIINNASAVAREQKEAKAAIQTRGNALTQAEEALAARENALVISEEAAKEALAERIAALEAREARVERILGAAQE